MKPEAMEPYGLALVDYLKGNKEAAIAVCRDDGLKSELSAKVFLRPPEEFSVIEKKALELCRGAILDVGGGGGSISIYLQSRRARIKAIDIIPELVGIMRWRGVENVEMTDIWQIENAQFDTILLLGNGIGMVETIDGLESFLKKMSNHLKSKGQLIFDSLDIRNTDIREHLKYQRANKKAGRYFGEIRLKFCYGENTGPLFGWLHLDPETLQEYAFKTGWNCNIVCKQDDGEYLAQLTRSE